MRFAKTTCNYPEILRMDTQNDIMFHAGVLLFQDPYHFDSFLGETIREKKVGPGNGVKS